MNRFEQQLYGAFAAMERRNNLQPGNETMTTATEVTARAKAFSSGGIQSHRFLIDADGAIRVWDSVADHYTTCHSLSDSAQRRIRKLAAYA